MWEFMSKYADSFWKTGDYAFEVFSVLMAWAITLGAAYFIFCFIAAASEIVAEYIKEYKRGRENDGKEK